MTYSHLDAAELERIRAHMKTASSHSHTSLAYQDQLMELIDKSAGHAGGVVEIGCYLGGLTVQLAYACKAVGKPLFIVDINSGYIAKTLLQLDQLQLAGNLTTFHGDFRKFCRVAQIKPAPFMFVVDGDHRYDGVVSDLMSILTYYPDSWHAVFHDFSLRYDKPDYQNVRVDRALRETLGDGFPIRPFGQIAGPDSGLYLTPSPRDGHYHEAGQYEGAVIDIRAAARAAAADLRMPLQKTAAR